MELLSPSRRTLSVNAHDVNWEPWSEWMTVAGEPTRTDRPRTLTCVYGKAMATGLGEPMPVVLSPNCPLRFSPQQ